MTRRYWAASLAGCGYLVCAAPSVATSAQSVADERLHAAVQAEVRRAITAGLTPAQRAAVSVQLQLRGARGAALQPCDQAWEVGPVQAPHWRRVAVPVQCGAHRGSVAVHVHAMAPQWTARHDLPRGHVLRAHDVELQPQPLASADDWLPPQPLQGLQLRRQLAAGGVLQAHDVAQPQAARKGQKVEIRAQAGDGVEVRVPGVAERSALVGEPGRALNPRSQRWISGHWVAPGVLEAGPLTPGTAGVKVQMEWSD